MDVALLPFNERFRELPPTAETFIVNGTSSDQLKRVREFLSFAFTASRVASKIVSVYSNRKSALSLSIAQDLSFVINRKLSLTNGISATRNCPVFFSGENWLRTYANDILSFSARCRRFNVNFWKTLKTILTILLESFVTYLLCL